jgi:hypothetical protein
VWKPTTGLDLMPVTNSSGATASAGQVGYLDESGAYKTTVTAYDDCGGQWCVVVRGGANGDPIRVARHGVVPVTMSENCAAGEYLYTSTTAGQALAEDYVRPEIFAVALTANSSGAGGTCQALLLTGRSEIEKTSDYDVLQISGHSGTLFSGTIATLPGGVTLTYAAGFTGYDDSIDPSATTQHGKLVLHNPTADARYGTPYALISSVTTGTRTITLTANVPGDWIVGDTIQVNSRTNLDLIGTLKFFDVEIESTDFIPALATGLVLDVTLWETNDAQPLLIHPYETGNSSKRYKVLSDASTGQNFKTEELGLNNRRFCFCCQAGGSGTATPTLRLKKINVAVP